MVPAAPLSHEGLDHCAKPAIPQPTTDDLATPEAAEQWAEREFIRATPRAVQEVIHQLRYGDVKQRQAAAFKILDRGNFKEGNKVTNIAPVIVLTADALATIPWAKKAVVDGTVISKQLPANDTGVQVRNSQVSDGAIEITKGDE